MNKLRVLADRHHQALTNSLRMLFEDRLGHELYFQFGMDWYPEYWAIQPFESTARQYLESDSRPFKDYPAISNVIEENKGIYLVESFDDNPPNKGITLERFKQEKFDILIASVPQHIPLFKKLIELYQPQAKLIYQIGNAWNIEAGSVKNVMASAKIPNPPSGINLVEYHQEFDLDIFHYQPVKPGKKIYSFINCLGQVDLYKKDWELFLELERLMPDWEFKSFGGLCRDGSFSNVKDVADKMREATYIFHVKTNADGFGHVIHQAAAVGRPLITRFSDYKGKLAEPLILDGNTCITVDNRDPQEIVQRIISHSDPVRIEPLSRNIYSVFKENVNFDKEEQKIKEFLERLL